MRAQEARSTVARVPRGRGVASTMVRKGRPRRDSVDEDMAAMIAQFSAGNMGSTRGSTSTTKRGGKRGKKTTVLDPFAMLEAALVQEEKDKEEAPALTRSSRARLEREIKALSAERNDIMILRGIGEPVDDVRLVEVERTLARKRIQLDEMRISMAGTRGTKSPDTVKKNIKWLRNGGGA